MIRRCTTTTLATPKRDAFATRAVHAGAEPDELTGAVSPPIYQTSTYAQDGVGRPRGGYEYARTQNPTRERLERAVADLEGGRHGIAFASGSATTSALAQLAAAGEEILVGDDVYGGTYRYFERVHRPAGAGEARYADLASGPDALWEGLNAATRLVWLETPSNPLLKVTDIAAVAATIGEWAAQAGRGAAAPRHRQHVRLAGPPAAARAGRGRRLPLRDQVPRRALGHDPGRRGDERRRGGRAAAVPAERDGRRARAVRLLPRPARPADARAPDGAPLRERAGGGALPGRARRTSRGCATRGWPTGRTRTRARRWPRARCALGGKPAAGGMVSFIPAAGGAHGRTAAERAVAICESTRLFTLAESLGGVESLIEVPAAMTHMSVASSSLAVDPALIRLSVGIEAAEDLVADLARALDGA